MPTSRKARSIRKVTPDNREFEELLRRAANFFQRHTQK